MLVISLHDACAMIFFCYSDDFPNGICPKLFDEKEESVRKAELNRLMEETK